MAQSQVVEPGFADFLLGNVVVHIAAKVAMDCHEVYHPVFLSVKSAEQREAAGGVEARAVYAAS